ncbi:MAG: glycosyltransferase [Desulfomonilia bacterium]|jgi:spore maturation protein CgeB
MPKVVVFGFSKRHTRTVAHIVRAFRDRGNETLWINPARIKRRLRFFADRYMIERVRRFNADIIFIFNDNIPVQVLREVSGSGVTTIMCYVDWRPEIPQDIIVRARMTDFFLVTSRGLLDEYRRAGVRNPVYFTEACDQYNHKKRRPILPVWKSDVAFIGAARSNELRVRLVMRLKDICSVKIYGRKWGQFGIRPSLKDVYPRGYALVCGGAKIVLGADITSSTDGCWSNRLWLTLGCGGFLLTNYVPGMEEFFTNREHLVWYRNEEECVELVKEFLAKPEERERIAAQGYDLVHEHHTFHHFVDKVLSLYEGGKQEKFPLG